MREVHVHVEAPDHRCELLGLPSTVHKDEPFLPPVQLGEQDRGGVEGVDRVDDDVGVPGDRPDRLTHGDTRRDHPTGPPVDTALQPPQQILGVADGRAHPDPLQRPPDQVLEAREHGGEVPAAVVAGKGVDLVDHHGAQVREQRAVVGLGGGEHRLDGFGCGEQDVRWVGADGSAGTLADVPVPHLDAAAHPRGVVDQTHGEVVEQRLERGHVQDGQPGPVFVGHAGEDGEDGGLGLAAGGRREQ